MSSDAATLADGRPAQAPPDKSADVPSKKVSKPPAASEAADAGSKTPSPGPTRHVLLVFQGHHGEFSRIDRTLFRELRHLVGETVTTPRDETEIDLWLESGGGDAHAAYKIALLLRSRARTLRVVVPDYAKSAATLLSLAADEIYMAEAAELGPLDAQIGYEKQGMTISALDMARSLDDLASTSMLMVLAGGGAVLEATQLSRADSLSSMVDFATKFMTPVIDKLDPMMIHWSSSLLDVAVHYADRLLAMRQPSAGSAALVGLPQRLMQDYPAHGFVISRTEARGLGLSIVDLEAYVYGDGVATLFHDLYEQHRNVVRFVDPEQLEASLDKEDPS